MPVDNEDWGDDDSPEPLDITNVGANPGPGPSSEAPDHSTEPHPLTDEAPPQEAASEVEEPEPVPKFDPRFREDFEGLMYIGRLTRNFTWLGHSFTIRTLSTDELLEVGLLHKPYINTLADAKAYQTAVVAACVVEVDHQPMPVPVTNDPADTWLLGKFNYVKAKWFPPTMDAVYEEYLKLESRVTEVIEAMGKVPG